MTWLELYKFLNDNANSLDKVEDMSQFWNQEVFIYDLNDGDKYKCDTLIIDDQELVLSINNENN
jgi:hypothetical protein